MTSLLLIIVTFFIIQFNIRYFETIYSLISFKIIQLEKEKKLQHYFQIFLRKQYIQYIITHQNT
jgi:hypothetical protein